MALRTLPCITPFTWSHGREGLLLACMGLHYACLWYMHGLGLCCSALFSRPHRCLGSHYQLGSSCRRLLRCAAEPCVTAQGVQRRGRDKGGKGRGWNSQLGEAAMHDSECA